MEQKIGLKKKDINKSIKNLTVVLSNEMVLYIKTRKFHWNISGKSFMEFHKLFEEHYNSIELTIDEVAERISKLGGEPIGSMEEFLKHATLKESNKNETQEKMLSELLKDHEEITVSLRSMIAEMEEEYNDFGTVDFLTAVIRSHESKAWALRKYLIK